MRAAIKLSVAVMLGWTLALLSPAIAAGPGPAKATCAWAAMVSAAAHNKGKTNKYADTILVMCAAAAAANQSATPVPGAPPATDQYGNPLPQGSPPPAATDQYGNPIPQGSPSPTPTDQYGNPLPTGQSTMPTGQSTMPSAGPSTGLNSFAGNWLITADKTYLMQLYATGNTITGTYDQTGLNGSITNGTLNGDTLTYSWSQAGTSPASGTGTFRLTTPNHIDGTWTTGANSGNWSGDRQ